MTIGTRLETRIVSVDGHSVEIPPAASMLVVRNDDRPGMIGLVGVALGEAEISIASMAVGPDPATKTALMVLSTDDTDAGVGDRAAARDRRHQGHPPDHSALTRSRSPIRGAEPPRPTVWLQRVVRCGEERGDEDTDAASLVARPRLADPYDGGPHAGLLRRRREQSEPDERGESLRDALVVDCAAAQGGGAHPCTAFAIECRHGRPGAQRVPRHPPQLRADEARRSRQLHHEPPGPAVRR